MQQNETSRLFLNIKSIKNEVIEKLVGDPMLLKIIFKAKRNKKMSPVS